MIGLPNFQKYMLWSSQVDTVVEPWKGAAGHVRPRFFSRDQTSLLVALHFDRTISASYNLHIDSREHTLTDRNVILQGQYLRLCDCALIRATSYHANPSSAFGSHNRRPQLLQIRRTRVVPLAMFNSSRYDVSR